MKKRLARLLIILFLPIIFFCLGYGLFYLNSFRQFVNSAMSQNIKFQTTLLSSLPNQTNILLLGSDNDQKFTGNPLTQTMMVIHIDYGKKEVDMFSIPRDLWVRMPNRPLRVGWTFGIYQKHRCTWRNQSASCTPSVG